ncbi:hypothetical protein ACFL3I_03575 [Pseudomonadota bacterium]
MSRSRKPEEGMLDRSSSPCRAEALDLLAIADTLTAANAKLGKELDGWRQRVNDLLAGPVKNDLATEWQLEELAMDFRYQWITLAHSVVAGAMRSPPSDHLPLLPISRSSYFLYERILTPEHEKNLKRTTPEIPGWQMEITFFSSGMAAITAAITVMRRVKNKYRRDDGRALQLDMFGGYFETLKLLDLLSSSDLRCQSFQDEQVLLDRFASGETDILFLELIAYDWKQTVIDPVRLMEALAKRPENRPWILMVDTTLLGPLCELEPVLAACGEKKPVLVMEIRSGLKLEQVGLEFSNVGIIKILTPADLDTTDYMDAKQLHKALSFSRGKMGLSLSLSQVAILDAPWMFHPEWTLKHTQAVMDNNRRLALALSGITGLFSRLNHPALGPRCGLSWAESPLVVMEFHASEDNEENERFLLAVIIHEVRKRKLVFQLGASFGFRHHRCEIIKDAGFSKSNGKYRRFFKMAMGSRSGPSLDGIIELMQELATFPDFKALRGAYSQIKPDRELARFPDLRSINLLR